MPRPSQYSRGRRVVMQLTLVLVLAATLSLAGLIARSRERALAVELTSHPIPHGGLLDVRLPKGWKWAWDSSELPVTVTAIEQLPASQESSRDPRDAVIYELVTNSNDPADLLRLTLSDNRGRPGTLSRFEILGHNGYIMRYDAYKPVPNDPFGRYLVVPGWFAAGLIPGAGPEGKNLGVVIGVEGYDTAGPAGRGLIRQLADGLSLPK